MFVFGLPGSLVIVYYNFHDKRTFTQSTALDRAGWSQLTHILSCSSLEFQIHGKEFPKSPCGREETVSGTKHLVSFEICFRVFRPCVNNQPQAQKTNLKFFFSSKPWNNSSYFSVFHIPEVGSHSCSLF